MAEAILVALRRVTRAIDQHSRKLVSDYGLTGPQALILRELKDQGSMIPSQLARRISLSQATVTEIVKRLEQRGYIARHRAQADRRKVELDITPEGERLMASAPPLLQEKFSHEFNALADWEQALLLSSVQRIAAMMGAQDLDAAPLLTSAEPTTEASALAEVLNPLPTTPGREGS